MNRIVWIAPLLLLTCFGCNQSDAETAIQDGAEFGTVAAVAALDVALPGEANLIIAGLQKVSGDAVSLLSFPTDEFSLEQLINLDMARGDPNLVKYRAIINFVLPILNDIPGVSKAMNTKLSGLPLNVAKDVKAFFTGIQLALAQPSGTSIDDLCRCNPRIAKLVKKHGAKYGASFDINGLINALKATAPAPKSHSESAPIIRDFRSAEIVTIPNCATCTKSSRVGCANGLRWRIVGTNDYVAHDGSIVHGE